jgi:hypothetical protein
MGGPTIKAGLFAGRRLNLESEFGGNDDLIADSSKRFADDLLIRKTIAAK